MTAPRFKAEGMTLSRGPEGVEFRAERVEWSGEALGVLDAITVTPTPDVPPASSPEPPPVAVWASEDGSAPQVTRMPHGSTVAPAPEPPFGLPVEPDAGGAIVGAEDVTVATDAGGTPQPEAAPAKINPTQVRHPLQAAIRGVLFTAAGIVVVAPFAKPIVESELGRVLPPNVLGTVLGVLAAIAAVAGIVTRLAAIPFVNEALTRIGVGAVPAWVAKAGRPDAAASSDTAPPAGEGVGLMARTRRARTRKEARP